MSSVAKILLMAAVSAKHRIESRAGLGVIFNGYYLRVALPAPLHKQATAED